MKRIWAMLLLCVAVGLSAGAGTGMQTLSIGEQLKIDAIGDASISINFSLTAAQYANWNQKYGQNKSLLKRDVGKIISQYDTYDWDVQVKEMERQVMVGVKAHGAVEHKGNGLYEFEVPKNWKGGQRNGNSIDYNFVDAGTGVIEQFNCKVVLPDGATDIKDETGESGQRVLRYTVPGKSTFHWVIFSLGALGCLFGVFVMGLGLIIPGRKKAAAVGM